ncbi:hypothetical protein KEM54_003165 [Ascosphaera aggregata]|nr:hypothetical protein KEM54_003165 [Ascosphaera aggregata]
MDAATYADYPPSLSQEQEQHLTAAVKAWAIQHGLAVKPATSFVSKESDPNGCLATHAPVTLFPSLFPRSCYDTARAVQKTYNQLYAAIPNDEKWLGSIVEELAQVDDFIANLWKVHQTVKKEGYVQDLSLGLFRSDYIAHRPKDSDEPSLKQVEFNTIASSFAGLSSLVTSLHTSFIAHAGCDYPPNEILSKNKPPENFAIQTLAGGLAAAHSAYGPAKSDEKYPTCILFIIQSGERNIYDQLALSSRVKEVHHIPVFNVTTTEITTVTSIPSDNPSRPLIYTPPWAAGTKYEVTTVYLRSFYGPADYPDESAWACRLHLERSGAIKCPSVLGQLSGCKKVQQYLADPAGGDHLTHFLFGKCKQDTIDLVRSTFAPQYDLSASGRGRELATNPDTAEYHVLKPQREGGGNNIYRSAIPGFLKSVPEKDWQSYILMELIQPPRDAKNALLRSDGELAHTPVIGELGVYGTILWNKDGTVLHNEEGGYLYRTKSRDSDEGGVAAGFSALDSILLL